MQRGASALAALVTVFAVGFAAVNAQNNGPGNGFQVSPVRWPITVEKGQTDTSLTISVTNPSDSPVVAQPVVNDFVASSDESGEPRLILDEDTPAPKNSFKKLVSRLDPITLGPREKKDIQVTITVPEDASAGGYYGAVRFVPEIPNNTDVTNVGLTASVGTIVLVRVPGNLTEKLDLVQISAATKTSDGKDPYKAKSFFTSGDVAMITRLKNSGDIHVQPFGKVIVKNMFGKTVQEFEFNPTDSVGNRASILPDSVRKFGNDLQKAKWFGRYTVEANLGYGDNNSGLLTARTSFWYIPTLILYAIIAAILAIVGTVYWFIRKQKARKQHKHDVNKRKS